MKTAVELPHDKVTLVNVQDVISYLSADPNAETVKQLYEFGKLLLDQIRGLRASYDAKLTSCLGWGTATMAVMLAGFTNWANQGVAGDLARVGIATAFLSVVASIIGFKSVGGWIWPSEKDWFSVEYFNWPERLKIQHVIAMLEAHQSYSRKTQRKGKFLMFAEYSLAASAISIGLAVLLRQVG